jgi:hypothetical protein
MALSASAQVGVINGSANSLLACVATAAGTPELRPEGYTELAGDIVISCTGGPTSIIGTAVPTTNVVIYMQPAVPITSRFMDKTGGSEALLIIDEAGSTISTGATPAAGGYGYGPQAPQVLCTLAQQQASGGSVCTPIVGVDGSKNYQVSVLPGGGPAPNVFEGRVGDFGINSVAFYNVPVLPPATTGVSRTFRITNIRVPVPGGILGGQGSGLLALVSTSPSATLPVAGTAIDIGYVGPYTQATVTANKTAFTQCTPQSVALTASLTFTEGFATAFKTRVVPGGAQNLTGSSGGNVPYAAEMINTAAPSNQNIPGGLYGGFAANSESGFIFPGLNTGTSTNYTAGLADYGTRLKATFYNIPAGLTLYVSTVSTGTAPVPVGGTSVKPYAVLVATNTGEAASDGTGFGGGTSGIPIVGTATGSDTLPAYPLTQTSTGSAEAVWEVTNANPSAQDVLSFSVYVSYTALAASTTNPYGLPITGLGTNPNDVQLSFAPEPSTLLFSTANATQGATPTPRFAVYKTQEGPFLSINLCQTTLLYPFVTGAQGFDTGIAVANTSMDPFGTVTQTGSCTLYAYGATYSSTGATTFFKTTVSGCDQIGNPSPGGNCFGGPVVSGNPNGYFISPGTVGFVQASNVLQNFQGYVIAICNFQYAHGYAALTDLGLRNYFSSYLALELSAVGIGSPRKGVFGIETLAH